MQVCMGLKPRQVTLLQKEQPNRFPSPITSINRRSTCLGRTAHMVISYMLRISRDSHKK